MFAAEVRRYCSHHNSQWHDIDQIFIPGKNGRGELSHTIMKHGDPVLLSVTSLEYTLRYVEIGPLEPISPDPFSSPVALAAQGYERCVQILCPRPKLLS